jgi:hypothetical protein
VIVRTEKNGVFFVYSISVFLASLDLVRNVQLVAPIDNPLELTTDIKTVGYRISWDEPLTPNGLVYFYTIFIDQYSHNGPKDERCVGHDTHSINVSLLPRTKYRLRIITYTIARLNHEYGDSKLLNDEAFAINVTNLYYQILFTTIDLPSKLRI